MNALLSIGVNAAHQVLVNILRHKGDHRRTLWNTYAFFVLYAEIDGFDATKYTLDYEKLPVMDYRVI